MRPREGAFDLSNAAAQSIIDAIVNIITRHPMREDELTQALEQWTPGQVQEALQTLAASGQAQVVERYGSRFWSAAEARYPVGVQRREE